MYLLILKRHAGPGCVVRTPAQAVAGTTDLATAQAIEFFLFCVSSSVGSLMGPNMPRARMAAGRAVAELGACGRGDARRCARPPLLVAALLPVSVYASFLLHQTRARACSRLSADAWLAPTAYLTLCVARVCGARPTLASYGKRLARNAHHTVTLCVARVCDAAS